MPLSRLENFLKNVQGNVIYVNPEELDATDDISNTGNSRTRPFRTIQRALIESARFSYQLGKDNDKFDKTTIVVSPGVHYVDNRPGYQIDSDGNITDINGVSKSITEYGIGTNFDVHNVDNVLYHYNSIHGGVILPRGTSIVGQDIRKTKIRPKYIPDPQNDAIPSSAIFRVTGGCFFYGFSIFDGEGSDRTFKDFTENVYAPNFSHHKLTVFEYADGNNTVAGKGNTDLDMYYAKLTLAYGTNSGRALPSYPTNDDFEKLIDENRIVGAISQIGDVEIEDIYSGIDPSATTATSIVTVKTKTNHRLAVGTPILIFGVNNAEYDGSHIVSQVVSDTQFSYTVATTPTSTATPSLSGLTPIVTIESDTVTSSSPYVFNCSIRSVFGLCGLHCDGDKATGFKSMLVAQFTGISLQKDDNAFVKYNTTSGAYEDQATLGTTTTLHTDSLARYKPGFEHYHVKASNNAVMQLVSVFAIGYGQHFKSTAGGDMSITNSNSNFGAKALESDGFRKEAFTKDDKGFITSIVPPKRIVSNVEDINWQSIDVESTVGVSTDTKLFLFGHSQKDNLPNKTASGFVVGNKTNEKLFCTIENVTYGADVLMPGPSSNTDTWASGKKEIFVGSNSGINSITSNIFTLEDTHKFLPGENVRVFSETGALPDGVEYGRDYYAVTSGLNADQIKIATTFNNAIAGSNLTGINNLGGKLRFVSTVESKEPGDVGHPVQYESGTGWYINVGAANTLRSAIVSNQSKITPRTVNTFVQRQTDNRKDLEKIYRVRYVVPDDATVASPPTNGFSIAESGSFPDDTNYKNDSTVISSTSNLKIDSIIVDATWNSGSNAGIITAQFPHRLSVGQGVEIRRLRSVNNADGTANSGYNGLFDVLAIDDARTFRIGINTDPGGISTITTNVPYTLHDQSIVGSGRTFAPFFNKRDFGTAYQIYTNETIQEYKRNIQDGVYDLTVLSYVAQPSISPFSTTSNFFPQDVNDLRPKIDIDNPVVDPQAAISYAKRNDIGIVQTNDSSNSISREGIDSFIEKSNIGVGITGASVSGSVLSLDGGVEHGFNSILTVTDLNGGSNYVISTSWFNVDLVGGTGKGATADVTVNSSGVISSLVINNHGSGYTLNDVVTVRGVPFASSGSDATVRIDAINNNVGDIVQVVGVGSDQYNGLHRITGVTEAQRITYSGTADDESSGGFMYHVGVTTGINNITYDAVSGIATVTLHSDIGLRRGDQIVINDANAEFNGTHFITDRIGYGSSVNVSMGALGSTPTFSGATAYAHGTGISARGNNQTIPIYDGVTTPLTTGLTTTTSSISLLENSLLRRGDYLQIEDEIVRISNKDCNSIIRGVLGTNATNHDKNVAAIRIKVLPVENRRYSILRASGHTFEYVGHGPGNYSTAMPSSQDRILTDKQQLAAQSTQTRGGLVVYTGMNDKGEFYVGRRKTDAVTGESSSTIDEFDTAPTGSSLPKSLLLNSLTADDLSVNENLYSNKNTDVLDIKLRGNRQGTKGVLFLGIQGSEPTVTNQQDNILFKTTHDAGGYIGWVRTSGVGTNRWQQFGPISTENGVEAYAFEKLAIGQAAVDSGEVLSVTGNASIASLKVDDLNPNRIVLIGTDGELQDSSSFTWSGSTLTAHTSVVTNNITVGGASSITGDTYTGGSSTFGGGLNSAGVCTATAFVGNGIIPVGGIIMWSGLDGDIPANWNLCDGTAGTPNLIDRFVVTRGNAYSAGQTGGQTDTTLVSHDHSVTTFISDTGHTHSSTIAGGNHTHSNTLGGGDHSHSVTNAAHEHEFDHSHTYSASDGNESVTTSGGASNVGNDVQSGTTSGISSSFTDETIVSSFANTNNAGVTLTNAAADAGVSISNASQATGIGVTASTDEQGSSATNKNLPPFYALAFIMRIS